MKIAILGTRGIPNNYGGFEQLAQFLSVGLKSKGHEVYVYNSSSHPYKEASWNGIHLIHKNDPEKRVGTVGQFIYDFNCIMDARKRQFDVILNLGYTSSSLWMGLFPKKSKIVTNMDGLEWKRSKYGKKVQKFLRHAEKWAVKGSHALVADSMAIQDYLKTTYNIQSTFIAYGAEVFTDYDAAVLKNFGVDAFQYDILIARLEPENNIETILDGVATSAVKRKFFVVGSTANDFGRYLQQKFKSYENIVFTGPNYNIAEINNLRYYANLYFHGHSVGGTNPSLLEAMGCSSLICAHNNVFNRSVLADDAIYFQTAEEVSLILQQQFADRQKFIDNNIDKIKRMYAWTKIVSQYEQLFIETYTSINAIH